MKEKDKWYAITSDCSLKECESPSTSSRFRYWVKQFDTGRRNLTTWGTNWVIHEYEYYDKNIEPIKYEIDGWYISKTYESDHKNAYDFGIRFDIVDPEGVKRTINSRKSRDEGIEVGLKRLHTVSKFNSWQMYDLSELNKQLENKNRELTTKVNEYEVMINDLKSSKFYKDLSEELNPLIDDEEELERVIGDKGLTMDLFEKWIKIKT